MLIKLLGLQPLVNEVLKLRKQNEELQTEIKELTEKVDEIEIPDMDDYVLENDIDSKIDDYLCNNDYLTEDRVSELVESAVEDIDLTDKVKEVVDDMDKASFGDTEELKAIVKSEVKSFMLNSVKIDFIVR